MNIALASPKQSPGATTLGLALTSTLAEGRDDGPPVLFELDEAGGDIAARIGVPIEPGLSTMAAATRHGAEAGSLWSHAHSLPAGGAVVVAPTDPLQARSAVANVHARLGQIIRAEGIDAVLDYGRLADGSADGRASSVADVTLVVCRPDLAGIEHAAGLVRRLLFAASETSIGVVTIGDRPYGPGDVSAAMDGIAAWTIPWDPSGAAALLHGPSKRARRTPLNRAAATLAENILQAVG